MLRSLASVVSAFSKSAVGATDCDTRDVCSFVSVQQCGAYNSFRRLATASTLRDHGLHSVLGKHRYAKECRGLFYVYLASGESSALHAALHAALQVVLWMIYSLGYSVTTGWARMILILSVQDWLESDDW